MASGWRGATAAGVSATVANPARRSSRSAYGSDRHAGERHDKRCGHRRPDRLAIQRVGRCLVQHDGAGAKRCRVAEDAADVVGVGDAFEQDDRSASATVCCHGSGCGRSPMARHPRWMLNPLISFMTAGETT